MSCHCWLMDGFKDAKELIAPFTFVFYCFFKDFAVFVKSTFVFKNSRKFQKIPTKRHHHHHKLIKVR